MRRIKKNAQIYSIDSIIAILLFITIFISLTFVWERAHNSYSYLEERNDLEMISRNSLSLLLSSPGEPQTWHMLDDINQSQSIGLLRTRQARIDRQKVIALDEQYEDSKILSGFRGPGYEYGIRLEEHDDMFELIDILEAGYWEECDLVVKITRAAIFADNGNYAKITFRGCKR